MGPGVQDRAGPTPSDGGVGDLGSTARSYDCSGRQPWCGRLVERLGVPVYTPLPDTAQDLMDMYGVTAEQAGEGSPDLVGLLREKKGDARPYSPGDRLPFGVDASLK